MDQKSPHTEMWCDMMSANSNPGPCSPSTHLIERGLIFNNGNVVLEKKKEKKKPFFLFTKLLIFICL